ncbi:hypothetical protein EV363DRAFT_1177391, partial [Boletus edulis]
YRMCSCAVVPTPSHFLAKALQELNDPLGRGLLTLWALQRDSRGGEMYIRIFVLLLLFCETIHTLYPDEASS